MKNAILAHKSRQEKYDINIKFPFLPKNMYKREWEVIAMRFLRETSVLEVMCACAHACVCMCVHAHIHFEWVRWNGMRQEDD